MTNSGWTSSARIFRRIADVLRTDRLALTTTFALPIFALGYGRFGIWTRTIGVLVAFLLVPAVCWWSARGQRDAIVRRFWRMLAVGFSIWWVLLVVHVGVGLRGFDAESEVLFGVAFGALFLMLVAAIANHSHAPHAGHRRGIDMLALWPAATIFMLSLVAYFLVLPAIFVPGTPLRVPMLALLVTVDAYLTIQLAVLVGASGPLAWRTVHALLAVMTAAWLIGDLENLARAMRGADPSTSIMLRALWIWAVMMAARMGAVGDVRRARTSDRHMVLDPRTPAHTIAAAVALPLVHVLAWQLELFPTALRPRQDVLLLVSTLCLGSLAWFQHRMLSRVAVARMRARAEREETMQRRRVGLRMQRERERADAAVQAVEDRFATVFRACPSAMVITRLEDGVVVDLNERFEAISGLSRHACFGRTTAELGLWPHPGVRKRFAARLAAGKEIRNAKLVMGDTPENRRTFWVDATRIALEDGPGVLVLARPKDDETDGGARVLDDPRMHFVSVGEAGRIRAWSRGIEALTGVPANVALEKPLHDLFAMPNHALADAATTVGSSTFSLTITRPSGSRERCAAWWLPVAIHGAGILIVRAGTRGVGHG